MAEQKFVGNTENLESLQMVIKDKAGDIDDKIEKIYSSLTKINKEGTWAGAAADTFINKCNNSKTTFTNLVKFLNDYAEVVGVVNKNLEALSNNVSSTCKGVQ